MFEQCDQNVPPNALDKRFGTLIAASPRHTPAPTQGSPASHLQPVRTFGDHTVYSLDVQKHAFREYFEQLYGTDIYNLLSIAADYERYKKGATSTLMDVETDLHKRFYSDIKSSPTFKRLYCALIKDIYDEFFPDEPYLVYQSFPSVRIQYHNHTVVPPHTDSDDIGRHPLGEKNFLLPVTKMRGTNRMFIESRPGAADFQGVDMDYGELFVFNGNTCTHYNESNQEPWIRVSLDFRVMVPRDYVAYCLKESITMTNPRDPDNKRVPTRMIVGGYYQVAFKGVQVDDMMRWFAGIDQVVQSRPLFGAAEREAVAAYMSTGDPFLTEFKKTADLESAFQRLAGCKHAFMTTSGTTALMMAYQACGVGPGDEVIVPDYTMIATANAAAVLGARVVLVDVDPVSFTVRLDAVRKAVTPRTKVIVHVSLNNRCDGLAEIAAFCKSASIKLVEDAAQSVGCTLNGRAIGTYGDVGCFSLSTPKIISSGQGGVVVTSDDDLAVELGRLKNFGRNPGELNTYAHFGLNNKFNDLQAVVCLEQIKMVADRARKLRSLWDAYYRVLGDRMIPAPNDEWIPWFVDIYVDDRDELAKYLASHGVQTRPAYPPLHETPMYATNAGTFTNASKVASGCLFLPTHMLLSSEHVEYVATLVQTYLAKKE